MNPLGIKRLVTASILLLFSALLPACQKEPASEAKPAAVGEYKVAPDFTLPDLDGTKVSLSQYKGNVVLLNFWATWCPPCRLEMPTMEKAYQNYRGQGFEVVAVSVDTGPTSAVKHFLQELGLTFQVLLDPDMETLRAFRGFSLPTTVVIDRRGVIRSREQGYRDWTDAESSKLLQRLLDEKSS
ncbi:MAG: TlpA disulfide reductase family protein [Candidatus Methylomirabilales bacterium]